MVGRLREFQDFAGKQLCPEGASLFTDVEQWKWMQSRLTGELRELEKLVGSTPEEEGELLLALLMGYCVTVRNASLMDRILARARQVLPCLSDKVLQCKLAAFCYLEVPDRKLLELARSLIGELEQEGRAEEVSQLVVMFDL